MLIGSRKRAHPFDSIVVASAIPGRYFAKIIQNIFKEEKMKKILLILFNLLLVVLLLVLVKDEFKHTIKPESKPIIVNQKEDTVDVIQLLKNEFPNLFDKSSLKEVYKEDQPIDKSQIKSIDNLLGNFDSVTKVSSNMGIASGWFFSGKDQVDFILFIDNKNQVLGAGLAGIERPGLSKAIGKENADDAGWVGYINLDDSMEKIQVICKFKNKAGFYAITSQEEWDMFQNNEK